jgi:hypothetical protein
MKKLDKPIEPGFYWMRQIWRGRPFVGMKPGDASMPEIVQMDGDGWIGYIDTGGECADKLSDLVGNKDIEVEWYGPLTPPWREER